VKRSPCRRGFVVALVGAESTGKTTLAGELSRALERPGRSAAHVSEYLREFCDRFERTPRPEEQAAIAAEQTRRIDAAAAAHDIVVADTTALMIAVYSEWVFGDTGLHADAARDHRRSDLTLLTALDLAWTADGLQRDGPQVREPIDALVRRALTDAAAPFAVIAGEGAERLANALRVVEHALAQREDAAASDAAPGTAPRPSWTHVCERCGDPDCERRLLLPRSPPTG
jgi:nicotinamide riboside kinase